MEKTKIMRRDGVEITVERDDDGEIDYRVVQYPTSYDAPDLFFVVVNDGTCDRVIDYYDDADYAFDAIEDFKSSNNPFFRFTKDDYTLQFIEMFLDTQNLEEVDPTDDNQGDFDD